MKGPWEEFSIPNEELFHPFEQVNYAGSTDPDQTLYLTRPKKTAPVPLVIFFHGGGMTGGNRECPTGLYNGLYAVAEPRYRFTPAAPAPAQILDAAKCIAWCFENAGRYGIDRNHIFVGGMSAGAYLAAIAVMDPRFLAPYGLSFRDVAGLTLISGQMSAHFRVKQDLGRDNGPYNPLIDEYAPLAHLSPELPPILMVTGESGLDMPGRPEENAYMAASLRAMGHRHVFCYALPGHNHGGAFLSCDVLLLNFIAKCLENDPPKGTSAK